MDSPITTVTGTIANGQTVSSAFAMKGAMLLEVCLDSGYDGTAFTIQTSDDGVTYQAMQMAGADKTYTVAASKNVNLANDSIIANYVKIVAGTSQTGATTIKINGLVL